MVLYYSQKCLPIAVELTLLMTFQTPCVVTRQSVFSAALLSNFLLEYQTVLLWDSFDEAPSPEGTAFFLVLFFCASQRDNR